MIKISKKGIFFFLVIATFALRSFTDAVYVAEGEESLWVSAKYITLMLAILYGGCYLLTQKHKWKSLYILKSVAIAAGCIFLISVLKMIIAKQWSSAVINFAFKILFPAIVAVLIVNIGNADDIYRCFCWILCIAFSIYCVFEIGLPIFSADNFNAISFARSYSPFESHFASGTAAAMNGYFSYYRKNKFVTVTALLFALLTFKRLLFIYSIILFVLPMIVDVKRKLPKSVSLLAATVCCVMTLLYYWWLIPSNQDFLLNLLSISSLDDFTSGRSSFFFDIYSNPSFVNFGIGSCETYLGRPLEMDLIQLLIEVSVVGLAVFSVCYWRMAGTTLYCVVYMGFQFLNMLTSHNLYGGFIWLLLMTIFAQIELDGKTNTRSRFATR